MDINKLKALLEEAQNEAASGGDTVTLRNGRASVEVEIPEGATVLTLYTNEGETLGLTSADLRRITVTNQGRQVNPATEVPVAGAEYQAYQDEQGKGN
jgi:hypothetical protein